MRFRLDVYFVVDIFVSFECGVQNRMSVKLLPSTSKSHLRVFRQLFKPTPIVCIVVQSFTMDGVDGPKSSSPAESTKAGFTSQNNPSTTELPTVGFTGLDSSSTAKSTTAGVTGLDSSSPTNRSKILSCLDKYCGQVSVLIAEDKTIGGYVDQLCDSDPVTLEAFIDSMWLDA